MAAHLSWRLDRWILFALVTIGLVLGAAYSVKPVQLKGRGIARLVCLWLIIFVGPMLFIGLLVSAIASLTVLIFAAAFRALQMGIILLNTAEDYPEDRNADITTTIVALGLHRGITLAFWLTVFGALGVLATLFWQRGAGVRWISTMLPVVTACIFVTGSLGQLRQTINKASLEKSIGLVKQAAKSVPLWVTLVAWSALGTAFALFFLTKGL